MMNCIDDCWNSKAEHIETELENAVLTQEEYDEQIAELEQEAQEWYEGCAWADIE